MQDEKERAAKIADWNARMQAAEKLRNGEVDVKDTIQNEQAEMIEKKIEELKAEIKKTKKVSACGGCCKKHNNNVYTDEYKLVWTQNKNRK